MCFCVKLFRLEEVFAIMIHVIVISQGSFRFCLLSSGDGGGKCTRPGIVRAASGHSLVCAASGHSSSGTAKSGAPALAVCQKQNYYLKKHFSSAVLPLQL